MSLRLLDAGLDLTVWNRSPEKSLPALAKGARKAASPAALAAETDVVFLCLTDSDAVESVVFGRDGVAEGAGPNGVSPSDVGPNGGARYLVDFSSIRPDRTRAMAARLSRQTGMVWIDAPVSGGVRGAGQGSLAIMAGGEAADIEAMGPLVAPLCARLTHMGPVGAGQTTKLCNQVIVGCNLAAIAEAGNLARRAGVDAAKLPQAFKGGFADSIPLQIFLPRMIAQTLDPPLGHPGTMLKDVTSALDLGAETGSDMPMTTAAAKLYQALLDLGDGEGGDLATLIDQFTPPS